MSLTQNEIIIKNISNLIENSRKSVYYAINQTMVKTYFEIGRIIVEEEQNGKERAQYGKNLLKDISVRLTNQYGKGFSETNLKQMKTFYLNYRIGQTLSDEFKLTWSHYLFLMRITNLAERNFYEIESINNGWSLRELKRQFDTAVYERLSLGRNKEEMKQLSEKGQIIENPKDIIREPYILKFLGLKDEARYSENELESSIIDKLEMFLLELGKGYTFVGRQVRFTFDEKHFKVDLVFYNRLLKAFIVIDLKIGEVTHQDLGQMQMYVNYYDRFVKLEDENKTIGIIICKKKNDTLVEMTLPEDNKQIFASTYSTILPSKEELQKLIEEEVRKNKIEI